MTCPKCGNEVPEGKKFCGKCGTKLEDAPVVNNATNICAKCGAELTPGKKFCGNVEHLWQQLLQQKKKPKW